MKLEVANVSKRFAGLQAVRDVSLAVEPGEIVGVIGPNGAGKTTLLNLITGFLAPDVGEIAFGGRSIHTLQPHSIKRLGVSRTFQQPRLFGDMTVIENCLAGMHTRTEAGFVDIVLRTKRFRQELENQIELVRGLLEELGLTGLETRLAGTLSFGQQRRVEIARALASNCSLLCLDEPAAGTIEMVSEEISRVIRGLPRRGTAVIVIEHDMRVIRSVSDRLVAMNAGGVIAVGKPEAVLEHPTVVAAYLGSGGTRRQRADS